MKFLQALALGASLLGVVAEAADGSRIPRKHGPNAHKNRPGKHPRNIAHQKRTKLHEEFYRALNEKSNVKRQAPAPKAEKEKDTTVVVTHTAKKCPAVKPTSTADAPASTKTVEGQACPSAVNTKLTKAPKENIWRSLSGEETEGVIELLFSSEYNLTAFDDAGDWDNIM